MPVSRVAEDDLTWEHDPVHDGELEVARGATVEPRRPGDLVPFDPVVARRNRRMMGLIVFPAFLIGAAALVATLIASHANNAVPAAQVPAGYRSVSDGSFGYAVPSSWSQNQAYTDDVGDLDTSGRTGWAAEHLGVRTTPPTPGEAPPATLATFGEPGPIPYRLSRPQAVAVAGATSAFRYELSRPGGFTAVVIDAWQSQSDTEIWLEIKADPVTTATVAASLKG